jgi:predicted RNase H-like HicB family nuclease
MKTFNILLKQTEDGWWVAFVEGWKNAHAQGKTKEEAIENIKEVIELLWEVEQEEYAKENFERESVSLSLA